MSVIPCTPDQEFREKIKEFAEVLKTQSHELGDHGLNEKDFYDSGLFRGAIERIRGQFSSTMREKREFAKSVFNHMQDGNYIRDWESTGNANRHDYDLTLNSGKTAVIELKGCMDGANTTIFERPPHAQEFVVWSVCTNQGADPQLNAWSGIHTRLSAHIIHEKQQVDGVIIWDMKCGTIGRPCPKLEMNGTRRTEVGAFKLPPPCIYLMPATIPSPRNNPHPAAQSLENVELLKAFNDCFLGVESEINSVDFEVAMKGADTVRTTTIRRDGKTQKISKPTPIRRS